MAGFRDAVSVRVAPALPKSIRDRFVESRFSWSYSDIFNIARIRRRDARARLLIAPVNSASQAFYWARAAETLPGVAAHNMVFGQPETAMVAASDTVVRNANAARYSLLWARRQRDEIVKRFSHVLYESAQPVLGGLFDQDLEAEIRHLQGAGVTVGMVWHGSDVRTPSRHTEIQRHSPFTSSLDGLTERLETRTAENHRLIRALDVPMFVSTPDLFEYVPQATWLPTLTDPARWEALPPAQLATRRPVVLHVPSRGALKGTTQIQRALQQLHDESIIEYVEAERVPYDDMPQLVSRADLVIDQVGMGLYGIASIEALLAGRVVVAQAGDAIRSYLRRATSWELPIVEATPDSVVDVVREIAAHPGPHLERLEQGRQFARDVHSPARAALALQPFLTTRA